MRFILVLLVIFISVCALSITYPDMFRLVYHSIALVRNLFISTHLWPMCPFYILKTPENQKACGVFRGYKMETMARNGLIKFIIPR